MHKYLLLIPLILFNMSLFGQDKAEIKVIARMEKNQVYLRWAPTTPIGWQLGNKYGYRIERYVLPDDSVDNSDNSNFKVLKEAIMPLPKEQFEPLMDNQFSAIAAQAIYGESFDVTESKTDILSIINQIEENDNRFSFALLAADQNWETAEALGLGTIDTDIDTSLIYFYRIFLADTLVDYPVTPGVAYVTFKEQKPLPKISDIEAEFGDQSVILSWRSFYLQSFYTSYQIEKSLDGNSFTKTNQNNFLNLQNQELDIGSKIIYNDSIPNDVKVYYRIRGISPFGIPGPYSDTIAGKGNAKLKGISATITKKNITPKGISLEWTFPIEYQEKVIGFKVARGNTANGPFIEIGEKRINPLQFTFVDEKPEANNYYVINTYYNDTSFISSIPEYVQLYDSLAPASPIGLRGRIDTTGTVKIYWEQNKEKDLQGYHIYRVNDLKEEWYRINNDLIETNIYIDSISLDNLTQDIYYSISALDYHYNPSEYSTPLKLEKPDFIPPSEPVLLNYNQTDSTIIISWQKVISSDLLMYSARISVNDTIIENNIEIAKDKNEIEYIFKKSGNYTLQLVAVDSSGNNSSPLIISANSSIPKKNTDIQYTIDRQENTLAFNWVDKEVVIDIYKSINSGAKRLVKSQVRNNFIDQNINPNNEYLYSFHIWKDDNLLNKKDVNIIY